MGDPYRVAVVGLGIGRLHVRAYRRLRDRYTVTAVCDIDQQVAAEVAGRIDAEVLTFEDALSRDDIDVVDLCTPPALHRDQVVTALDAGKHVVCEKPLVGSLADADLLAAAAERARGQLMPIFQYRFGTGLQQMRALVDEGVAGRAYTSSVELAWRRRADYYAVPWRGRWETELGGVLLAQAIHLLDMLTFIAGPVARVFCRTTTRVNDVEVEDCAVASLELGDGSLASVTATLGSADELSRHRFHFANLSAESGTEPYTSSSAPWKIVPETEEVAGEVARVLAAVPSGRDGWEGQFERFADALDSGAPPPVSLADARASLELITALYASARWREDVSLPIPKDHPMYQGWRP